jgi:RNA polymerase sigma-70 factor (ECF subfamily)
LIKNLKNIDTKKQIDLSPENSKQPNFSRLLSKIGFSQDKDAFAEVFQYFAPRVKSYMVKLGCVDEMAEELAQQTLLQVWRKSNLYDSNKAAASTWIFRIARNIRIDMLRKQKHFFEDDFDLTTIEDDHENAEHKVNKEQKNQRVALALTDLPTDQAQIIRMSFYDGMSHSEIAKQLKIPLGTVKSRTRLAFARLRDSKHLETEVAV